ncbi:MAG: tetratricopeptide repeat protein [Pseudomonadota bacterium]
MKISRVMLVILAALALISASAGGYFYYQKGKEEKERTVQLALIKAQAERSAAMRRAKMLAENAHPLADKAMNEAIPKSYPRPVSDWKTTEKSVYQKLLSRGQFDVLVVPFQVQEYALDRPTRSLMTAELALAVSAGLKMSVPDPYLVARALGEGDRRLDPNEVYGLADKIGAKRIIWGYVGHDRKNQMALNVQSQERSTNGILNAQTTSTTKNFENIAFTDERPPIEVYQSMLPELLTAIGIDGSIWASPKPVSRFDGAKLPHSPLAMVAEMQNPARDALYFQLLAYLAPDAERTQERFAEKSYLAIHRMSPDSPDYRVLKARALMLLGLRPAALQALGKPKSMEEKELVAVLNGNQPDVELFSSKIKPSIKRFMAKRDANYLGSVYGGADKNKSLAAANSLKLPGEIWSFLAARAFSELDMWAQFDNINLKQLLDHEFPIKNYTAEGMIRGAASLGDTGKLQTLADLSVVNHVRKLLEIDAAKWCCQSIIDRPAALDYLNLIEAIGDDDLIRRADFLTEIQGVPEQTLEFLNRIENVYKGHPQFSLARAEAQIERAKSADGAEKEGLLKSAYVNLFDVMYWEQGQSFSSATAFNLVSKTGQQDYSDNYDNFYAADYPFRAYYPTWEQGGATEYNVLNAEAALRNSTSNLTALTYLDWYFKDLSKQYDKHDALLKSVEGRFAGNPGLYQLLAENSVNKGDAHLAEKYFRESIKVQPMVWKAYMDLGTLLIEQGQLKNAAKLFMGYPSFKKDSKENPVGISNSAHEAGSKFYWMGEFSLATQLYKIASRKETGSKADITSRIRLSLIDGDYRGALLGSLERANRYNDTYAYRDYLGLLHAMGAAKEAWDAFNVLANQTDDPHIWEAVLVGHRKEKKSELEITAWAKQEVAHNIGRNSNHTAKYLLRAGVTDRIPTKDLAASLADIALPAWENYAGYTVQPSEDGGLEYIVGPRLWVGKALQLGVNNAPQKTPVKSSLVYFAESIRAIRTGDFALARSLLQEASTHYDLSQDEFGYFLPYYAFAAAKTGDISAVEEYMSDFSPMEKGFDYLLAKAVISGIGGKTGESVKYLKSAFYRRPFTEARPLQTEYQYAEICEWLYQATGKSKYKEIALDWAKKNQKFQPWFAWAYAMEAALSNNKEERKQAIAMAYYLDPRSVMLRRIPKKEREIAIREFEGKNPFLKMDDSVIKTPV